MVHILSGYRSLIGTIGGISGGILGLLFFIFTVGVVTATLKCKFSHNNQGITHLYIYTSTLIVLLIFMLAESNNITDELESNDCYKDDHVGNMITISCQNQTANSLHNHLQYLESIEIEFNNPIYEGNSYSCSWFRLRG